MKKAALRWIQTGLAGSAVLCKRPRESILDWDAQPDGVGRRTPSAGETGAARSACPATESKSPRGRRARAGGWDLSARVGRLVRVKAVILRRPRREVGLADRFGTANQGWSWPLRVAEAHIPLEAPAAAFASRSDRLGETDAHGAVFRRTEAKVETIGCAAARAACGVAESHAALWCTQRCARRAGRRLPRSAGLLASASSARAATQSGSANAARSTAPAPSGPKRRCFREIRGDAAPAGRQEGQEGAEQGARTGSHGSDPARSTPSRMQAPPPGIRVAMSTQVSFGKHCPRSMA